MYTESEREANMTTGDALELALLYNFVTELTSLIVVADDNFTLGDGLDGGRNSMSFPFYNNAKWSHMAHVLPSIWCLSMPFLSIYLEKCRNVRWTWI